MDDVTKSELSLMENLPKPPALAGVRTTNIWIVEWLSENERRTGQELHDWIKKQRPGWSMYTACDTKTDVLASIRRAAEFTARCGVVPVLHIEAHGGSAGIAPFGSTDAELLSWEELTEPLQQLNHATKCNLVVVVAACIGFAGVLALRKGPIAPAIALVGLDAPVSPQSLLSGTKELYRRWMDENPRLAEVTENASREAGMAAFEFEPFATLAYEANVKMIIKRRRQGAFGKHSTANRVDHGEIRSPNTASWQAIQQIWNTMFMIDVEPNNEVRFGVDWKDIIERMAGDSGA